MKLMKRMSVWEKSFGWHYWTQEVKSVQLLRVFIGKIWLTAQFSQWLICFGWWVQEAKKSNFLATYGLRWSFQYPKVELICWHLCWWFLTTSEIRGCHWLLALTWHKIVRNNANSGIVSKAVFFICLASYLPVPSGQGCTYQFCEYHQPGTINKVP